MLGLVRFATARCATSGCEGLGPRPTFRVEGLGLNPNGFAPTVVAWCVSQSCRVTGLLVWCSARLMPMQSSAQGRSSTHPSLIHEFNEPSEDAV